MNTILARFSSALRGTSSAVRHSMPAGPTARRSLSHPLGVGLIRLMSGQKERARIAVKPRALITENNQPHRVTKIQQGKRGKGGGFVKANLKNMMTGNTTEKTYTSDEMVELAHLEKSTVTFSWVDDSTKELVLMDTTTFEEVRVLHSSVDCAKYLSEGQEVLMLSFQDQPFDLEIPKVCEFVIESIDPSKSTGNTGSQTHPAIIGSGAVVQVPIFVTAGMRIKVNTEENTYVERA